MKEISRHIPPDNQYKDSTGFKDIPFLRSIIDASREIIALLDRDGTLIEFNRALEMRLKQNRDEIIGSCIWNYFPAEISENRKFLTEQVFQTGKAEHLEDCRNGIWNDSIISPVFDAKGAVTHVSVHILDITDQKKTEELKSQQYIMLENLSHNIPGVIFEFTRDKEGLYYMNFMSKGSDKIFGIPAEQLTGPVVPGLVHPADVEMFFRSINNSAESLTDWGCEYRIIRPEGKVKWIMGKSRPRKEADGRIIWNGVLVDISKEKNLEEELRNREIMLKTVQNAARLGNYQLDVQTGEAEWSDEIFNIFGLDPFIYIPSQQKYQDLIHPEDWGELLANLEESIEKKIPFNLVYRIFHSSGEIRYVHSLGEMVKNPADNTFKMLGTLQDITELKLAEVSLKKANTRLKALWNISSLSGSDFNTVCDSTLNEIVEMTGSPYGFLGFLNESESIMRIYSWSGRAMNDCMMTGRQDEFIISECGIWGEAVRQRKPLIMNDFNIPHHAKKGLPEGHVSLSRLLVVPVFSQERIVSVAAVANSPAPYTESDISQITSFMSGIQSILDRREAEAKLLASEESLRKAQRVAHLGSWEWYIETNRLSWSDEMYKIFGVSREEFTGDLSDIMTRSIHPDDRAAVEHSNRSVIEEGKPVPLEYRIILPDGSVRTVWAEAGELKFNKDGKPSVLSGIVQDITDRKKAEAEQKKLESQLQQSQKLDSIGQLAGGVAHDFNNQLSGIMGYAELISPDLDNEKLMRYAANIIKGAENGAKLTQQLLSFARKGNYSLEIIDIHEVLDDVIDILSHTIDKRITISQIRQVLKPTIKGDRSQIQNALLNISLNARDAIEKKGTIRFESKLIVLDNNSKYPLFDLKTGSYICISISDNGAGMDASVQSHIFDPFFTTKGVGKGTGMGLPAAYGTVQHHGGGIFVESAVLRGSTFHVLLPFIQAETGPLKPKRILKTSETPAEILIVDDDENFRNLLIELFESLGYIVYSAEDGEEGLEFYKQHIEQIDLIIMDIIMPKKGGEELFLSLKKINPHVKILISSGYSPEDKTISKIVSTGTPFIQKPCSINELSMAVSDILKQN